MSSERSIIPPTSKITVRGQARRPAAPGSTGTEPAGGTVTVIAAVPLCPSLVAVIVATPAATAVTRPLPFTVAAAVLLLAQVTVRPDSGLPLASFGVAV